MTDEQNSACRACGQVGLYEFYRLDGVPARAPLPPGIPGQTSGDIAMAYCSACGFIQNTRFDPALIDYSHDYHETQFYSPTFNAFAAELARHLISRYELRDQQVLEIGCGHGEFLRLICQLGGNRGIGFDPFLVPDAAAPEIGGGITWVRDFYDQRHAGVEAQLVCCRHTLEHLPYVQTFVTNLRRTLGERRDTVVVFEVPNVQRVLEEAAFWDFQYEHCGYFDAHSLAALFRRCGFEVLDAWTAFQDQLLILESRPGPGFDGAEQSPLSDAVARFSRCAPARIGHWQRTIRDALHRGERVVLWGANSKTAAFLAATGMSDQIEIVVDINPAKQDMTFPGGCPCVVTPEFLRSYGPDLVVAMNPAYQTEIGRTLEALGVPARLVSVR